MKYDNWNIKICKWTLCILRERLMAKPSQVDKRSSKHKRKRRCNAKSLSTDRHAMCHRHMIRAPPSPYRNSIDNHGPFLSIINLVYILGDAFDFTSMCSRCSPGLTRVFAWSFDRQLFCALRIIALGLGFLNGHQYWAMCAKCAMCIQAESRQSMPVQALAFFVTLPAAAFSFSLLGC